MNITVVGMGYVGLSLATLLAEHHNVTALDINEDKVRLIDKRISPIVDSEITLAFATKKLHLHVTTDDLTAYKNAEFVVIATPTNYDEQKNFFDTTSVETVIKHVRAINKTATIVIKSTVPVGFTKNISQKLNDHNILFSPEFSREGKALFDNLNPSRIIVGVNKDDKSSVKQGANFAEILASATIDKDVPILLIGSSEAEAIKLFSNTYLALRVSFFNELDTYALEKELNTKEIIEGVGLDPRIGNHYNNPSFGYGGYCLPKDTKQLKANYQDVPQGLISAVIAANLTRKQYIAQKILQILNVYDESGNLDGQKLSATTVGVYRIIMKAESDNFRESSILDVLTLLKANGINIILFEPSLKESNYQGYKVYADLKTFKNDSTLIVANRTSKDLADVKDKLFTRDLYMRD